jgi:DNA-binding MarR family transcriptional regulator
MTTAKRAEHNAENDYIKLRILIRQLSLLITKARDRELSEIGITSVQSAVLFNLLNMGKNATVGMLADRMLIESHTASGLVKRMEEQGLINILSPQGHRNRKYLKITAKGKRSYELSQEKDCFNRIFLTIPSAQCQELIKSLQLLREMILKHLSIEEKIIYP